MSHYLVWPFYQHDWLLSSLLPALVNHPQTIDLWWQGMRSTKLMLIVMMQVRLYQLSTPVIKLSISISKQSKGISSLLKQLVSNRKRRYLFHKFTDHTSQGTHAFDYWCTVLSFSFSFSLLSFLFFCHRPSRHLATLVDLKLKILRLVPKTAIQSKKQP